MILNDYRTQDFKNYLYKKYVGAEDLINEYLKNPEAQEFKGFWPEFSRAYRYAGFAYSNGKCISKNPEKAFGYFIKATKFNDKYSSRALGWSFQYGCGTKININKAKKYYLKAAEMGEVEAIANLGYLYSSDKENYNPEQSIMFLKHAIEKNPEHKFANFFIGLNYYNGIGVKKNIKKAIKHFERAAEYGVTPARNELMNIYLDSHLNGSIKDAKAKYFYWRDFKYVNQNENNEGIIEKPDAENVVQYSQIARSSQHVILYDCGACFPSLVDSNNNMYIVRFNSNVSFSDIMHQRKSVEELSKEVILDKELIRIVI